MLKELRNKPQPVRERYAFLGALAITSLIALIWLVAFFIRIQDGSFFINEENDSEGNFSQFFSNLKAEVTDSWQDQPLDFGVASSTSGKETEEETSDSSNDSQFKQEEKMEGTQIGTSSKRSIQIGTSSRSNP